MVPQQVSFVQRSSLSQSVCSYSFTVLKSIPTGDERCNNTEQFRQRRLSETSLQENTGRLEMCYNGYWGTVCRDYTDYRTAMVACRILGYTDVVKGIFAHHRGTT